MNFIDRISKEQAELSANGQLRILRETATRSHGEAEFNGRIFANFSGNDYLGLAGNPELKQEFFARIADNPPVMAATGSRLLGGSHHGFTELEATLERRYNKAALAFNSGYHANIGILPALTNRNSVVLSDKLNHASIIDGLRLCEGGYKRYKHLDYKQLEYLLQQSALENQQAFIVSESIFSMDGDTADLAELVRLKKQYNAVLVIDEAHSVGVCGEQGLGLCHQLNLLDEVDVMIGTFGKAFGSMGSYCISSQLIKEYLVNHMRSFIFSTALPPIVAMWSNFIFEKQLTMNERRIKLHKLGEQLRQVITQHGYSTLGNSQIVPLIAGENRAALDLAEKFRAAGLLVFAVRPPTVPQGTARLRFSLNADQPENVIERIGDMLK